MPKPSNRDRPLPVLRILLGYTQQQFAEKLGYGKRQLEEVSSGREKMSEKLAIAVCRETGVSYAWLTNQDPKAPILDCLGRPYDRAFYVEWNKQNTSATKPLSPNDRVHLLRALTIRIGHILSATISAIRHGRGWGLLSELEIFTTRLRSNEGYGSEEKFEALTLSLASVAAARPMHPLPPARKEKASAAQSADSVSYVLFNEFQDRIDKLAQPIHPLTISARQLNLDAAVHTFGKPTTSISKYVCRRLGKQTRAILKKRVSSNRSNDKLRAPLLKDLNRIVRGKLVWEKERFADIDLSEKTKEYLQVELRLIKRTTGNASKNVSKILPSESGGDSARLRKDRIAYLNKLLLSDGFPEVFRQEPRRLAFANGTRVPV
jgi:transcriptional regulator with XRE-family HTH domain